MLIWIQLFAVMRIRIGIQPPKRQIHAESGHALGVGFFSRLELADFL
jgi:hypothetical protein